MYALLLALCARAPGRPSAAVANGPLTMWLGLESFAYSQVENLVRLRKVSKGAAQMHKVARQQAKGTRQEAPDMRHQIGGTTLVRGP